MRFPQATSLILYLFWMMCFTMVWSQSVTGNTCDKEWFGSNCQYKCRCNPTSHCDADGSCPDGRCKQGWFGPGCQYVDLVYMFTSTSTPPWLTDGNESTCNTDQSLDPIELSLDFPITWLRLQVKDTQSLHGIQVTFFSNERKGVSIECENNLTATVNERTLDIHCDLGVTTVKNVSLTGQGVSSLCSLYISGGRNVALRQNTSQTSMFFDEFYPNGTGAEKAVDGNKNRNWHGKGCMSTNSEDSNPTWNVTLSQAQMINRYVIYTRDNYAHGFREFTLISFRNDRVMVFNHSTSQNSSIYKITNVPGTEPVSLVMIQAVNTRPFNQTLTMCEVELFGDSVCPPSMYGRECEHTCDCAVKNESCFVSTGGCPLYISANGSIIRGSNQSCDLGKYGQGCNSVCNQSCTTANISVCLCIHADGTCLNRCQNGIQTSTYEHTRVNEDQFPVAAVAGALTALAGLVIILVVGTILWRNSKHKTNKNISVTEGSVEYDNSNDNEQVPLRELVSATPDNESEYKPKQSVENATTQKEANQNQKTDKYSEDKVYYNTISGVSTTSIAAGDLTSFVALHDKTFFQQQFNDIPDNAAATTTAGMSDENKHKNRYKNITAYDHSRVLLKVCQEKKHGDYINASYVDGYKEQGKFIASQGPTKTSLNDFVRMLSEKGVEVVVMLTNLMEDGKTKCERYWPEDDEMQAGHIKVKLTTTQVFADYTIRRLQLLQKGRPVQTLIQFHFTSWPDKDVPTTAWNLVDFEQRVASISTDKPIVVHCSAGVGRTGTFIALHNVLREAMATGHMDFFTAVQKLRHDRVYMVQTPAQYEFIHRSAQVAVSCMGTTVASSNIAERLKTLESTSKTGQSNLELEYRAICALSDDITSHRVDPDMGDFNSTNENSQTLINKLKNRFQNVLAKADYRVMLMDAGGDGVGDYINAVFLPSFIKKNQQILTQIPLPATVTDFWRMVTQCMVTLVVAFELDMMKEDSSIGNYFPLMENEEISTPHCKIKTQEISSAVLWNKQRLVINMDTDSVPGNSEKQHRLIHLSCKRTASNNNPSNLLAFVKMIRSCSPIGSGRTVYMCRNGADYSGLMCVLSLLLDRLDNDHRLTVPLVVGAIKAIRPQVISTVQQYALLYQVLKLYNDSNNVYNNFGD